MADRGDGSCKRRKEPQDSSILYQQNFHMSSEITVDTVRTSRSKKCIRARGGKVSSTWDLDPLTQGIVNNAGFGHAGKASAVKVDTCLLHALMERWRGETHSFHLPRGELTITLQDVQMILGLRADGLPVTDHYLNDIPAGMTVKEHVRGLCQRLLGELPPEQGSMKPKTNEVYFTWLKQRFMRNRGQDGFVPADPEEAQRRARAYILTLFGTCLFANTSGNSVPLYYLYFLEDLGACNQYSWASAVLAYTYNGLGRGVLKGAKQVHCCAPLIQVWCWEHLTVGRPTMLNPPMEGTTAACYWTGPLTHKNTPAPKQLDYYRDAMKTLHPNMITWNPWVPQRTQMMPQVCSTGWELSRIRLPLIHMNIVEWQLPERVLRQFDLGQPIPPPVVPDRDEWNRLHKNHEWIKKIKWHTKHEAMLIIWGNRWVGIVLPQLNHETSEHMYMNWYERYTVTLVEWPTDTIVTDEKGNSGYYAPTGNAVNLMMRSARAMLKTTKKLLRGATGRNKTRNEKQLQNLRDMYVVNGLIGQFNQLMNEPVSTDSEETDVEAELTLRCRNV